jgi:hypothetical protein
MHESNNKKTKMSKTARRTKLQCLHIIVCLTAFLYSNISYSQSYNVHVSSAYKVANETYSTTSPPLLEMYNTYGEIIIRRFTSLPNVRKVASTNRYQQIGKITYGVPPQIYGHTSITFQYLPRTHTVNLFPGQVHVTTTHNGINCRVYENGTCRCDNPHPNNWGLCTLPELSRYKEHLHAIAIDAKDRTIAGLHSANFNVSLNENAVVLPESNPSSKDNELVSCAIEAGPLWSNAEAQGNCGSVCKKAGGIFNGGWWTTKPGVMSVCECKMQNCPK